MCHCGQDAKRHGKDPCPRRAIISVTGSINHSTARAVLLLVQITWTEPLCTSGTQRDKKSQVKTKWTGVTEVQQSLEEQTKHDTRDDVLCEWEHVIPFGGLWGMPARVYDSQSDWENLEMYKMYMCESEINKILYFYLYYFYSICSSECIHFILKKFL